jgi:hypothetical protein
MGFGKYCNSCGNSYIVKRITTSGILHDVFHFFTHLDKGFGFTLKQLSYYAWDYAATVYRGAAQ